MFRKELSAADRETETIRLGMALKKLNGEAPATAISGSDEAAETGNQVPPLAPIGGRGNKGVAQKIAERLGISKRAVRKRLKAASAAIGENIDLDGDTPEELERKADKRQHAERKVVSLKRRKPVPRGVVEDDPMRADPHAGEIGLKIEALCTAFDALPREHQLRFIHDACLHVGLNPLLMASPVVFGLADEDPELAVGLPAEVAPAADDDLPEQAEPGDEAAVAHAEEHDEAAAVQANQGDNGAEFGAGDLQDASEVPEAADPVIGAKERCAHCNKPFLSTDLPKKQYGRFWHRKGCLDHAKPIAIAA